MTMLETKNSFTNLFADVFLSELSYIEKRRGDLGLDLEPVTMEKDRLQKLLDTPEKLASDPNRVAPQTDIRPSAGAGLVGLALSGGGIRSATFNLGVLQGLARRGVLRCCDYLSTVSGGGYIGSCLSSLLNDPAASVDEAEFPFRFQRNEKPDERKTVKHLREHSNYLAVKGGFLEYARMLGTYLSGLVVSNFFSFAVLIFFGWGFHTLVAYEGELVESIPAWCLRFSFFILILLVAVRLCGAVCRREPDMEGRRNSQYIIGLLAGILVISAGSGLLTFLAINWEAARDGAVRLLSGMSLVSALGLVAGLIQSRSEKMRGVLQVFFRIGWVLILPVLFAWILQGLAKSEVYSQGNLYVTLLVALLLLILSLVIDNNRTSLHHFYRDRLSEAYIVNVGSSKGSVTEVVSNETLCLSELHAQGKGAPYHLINTTLNVPASTDRYLRGRGADLFFFSKNYVGSEATGYRETGKYKDGKTRLATAMAISGAAASPQMGTSTNKALRAVLTLLNVRLNRWMPNPNPDITHFKKTVFGPWYFLKELFGRTKESDKMLNLSDGGHHENLGIYPLLKRRCRVIIASDATADPKFAMNDLANVIRKARIDLGVNVNIRLEDLRPDPETGLSKERFAIGDIHYPTKNPDEAGGTLIYIKSAITGKEPEDLLSYRRKNPGFPDQSTADQFFDEAQFESYRKLGETTVLDLFNQPLGEQCLLKEKIDEIRKDYRT